VEHGTQATLRSKYGLDAEGIFRQVFEMFPDRGSVPRIKLTGKAAATQSGRVGEG